MRPGGRQRTLPWLFALLLGSGGACSPPGAWDVSYNYTQTTRTLAPPRNPRCFFELLSTVPSRPFDELGVVERVVRPAHGATDFMNIVGPQVCYVGGDAVIAEVNGMDGYVRGTVIRYRDRPPEEPYAAPAVLSPDARVGAVAPSTAYVRAAPSDVAPQLASVPEGTRLQIGPSDAKGWRTAKLPDGRIGYVHDADLKAVSQ